MSYPAISLATATVGRHRCPQKRLQTARQPPVYPNSSPDHRACNSLTPFRCPHAVHPCPSVDSGLEVSKAEAAEERSEQTRSFVRTVKAAARRKYTSEEKIRIVLEGFRREVTVNDLCRREGIKPHSYYSWTKEFMEAGKERLTRDSVRDATQHEVGQLKRENGELKELVADLSLEAYRLKKTAIPVPQDATGTSG